MFGYLRIGRNTRKLLCHLGKYKMTQNKPPPTLDEYRAFHSMVCPPHVARRCVHSIVGSGGVFLFGTPGAHERGRTDFSSWSGMWSYYLLVLCTLTGLSTLLGLTDEVDAREFSQGDETSSLTEDLAKWFRSERNESVAVSKREIEYCRRAALRDIGDVGNEKCEEIPRIKLRRRFEYDFHLIGANVIMVHFTTSTTHFASSSNSPADDGSGDLLHVVEVYQFRSWFVTVIERIVEEAIHFASMLDPCHWRSYVTPIVRKDKAS
uniref:Uncharacterized protein n=1 Tax=Odontella aurita TaxID=265563 RepID=A0A7S4MYQ3_9STRA|mmetsp:Transcript_39208/g.117900  ORF Transcript_39208/g.117900 Transcript_39208/m.117900 type:complete len:264 (+) Transcript_39208:93-884(+)